ncbi:hypothetical protein ECE50_000335 [Chitinophaga sp. Mgbs1]|uniref:Uncharacterized protein n=1 Tax=Chitinophaga solisilvae TaxID=1233460 RepID=A0A9Q5CZX7_9BACT|nr:hypothetical protein [Chitinophaga solisilvae]
MNYSTLLLYFLSGILIITIIDTIGAILSNVLQFKYIYLIVFSAALYIFMGYFVSRDFNLIMVIAINALLGLYDGSAGLWLSLKLNANMGQARVETERMPGVSVAITMMIIAIVLGILGHVLN